MPRSKTDPSRLKAKETALQALELRKAGLSYQRIADELGYHSPQASWDAVNRLLKKTIQEPADEVRKLEIERLDKMLFSLWARIQKGDHQAVNEAIKISKRRSELLGIDSPVKHEVTGKDGAPLGPLVIIRGPATKEEAEKENED